MTNGPLPPLSDADVAAVYRQAGFQGGALVLMTATALGESGGDPDILGDERLADAKWGPSVGIGQIRSLNAQLGTGGPRDAQALLDPDDNAAAAWEISKHGTDFSPWSVFKSGKYRAYLTRAWAAVKGVDVGTDVAGRPPELQGLQGLAGAPGGGIVDKVAEPIVKGFARVSLVAVFVIGGVGLVLAGGWRATAGTRRRLADQAGQIPVPQAQAAAAVAGATS